MNRRGFFGALVGGIAASAGIRALVSARMILPRSIFVGRSDVVISRVGAHLQAAQMGAFEPSDLATGAPVAGIRIPVTPAVTSLASTSSSSPGAVEHPEFSRDLDQQGGSVISPAFRPAYWRGLTAFGRRTGTAGLSFNTFDGDIVRLQLNLHDLEAVYEVTRDLLAQEPGTKVHSERSSGKPSRVGSPHDGSSVPPITRSSSADRADQFEPRSSSRNQGCHLPSRLCRMLKVPFRVVNSQWPRMRRLHNSSTEGSR